MKKTILPVILALALLLMSVPQVAFATSYTAMIAQGNTNDVGDCKAFYNWLNSVPNNHTYTVTNKGWTYSGSGTATANATRATAANLKSAKGYDVLYWSGHGGSNPLTLNETPSNSANTSGTWSEIDVASTLGVSGANWATNSEWTTSDSIKVAIFGACKILDNSYGETKYLARVMKASNVRVIAGFHGTSPTHPNDTTIVNNFFSNTSNNGVSGGESIRSSWQMANELNSSSTPWAVLCYTSNSNQYYRMPGFPGNTYSAPASNASVYRYRQGLSGNETISTSSATANIGISGNANARLSSLPTEIYASAEQLTIDASAVTYAVADSYMPIIKASDELTNREMVESEIGVNSGTQYKLATDFIEDAVSDFDLDDAILAVYDVIRDEIDPDEGVVESSETVVGKTYCYSNQYMGVRIADNFIKIGTDEDGVYYVINKWQNVEAAPILNSSGDIEESILTASEALDAIDLIPSEIDSCELVYASVGGGSYRLSYEVVLSEGGRYFVDCVTGEKI